MTNRVRFWLCCFGVLACLWGCSPAPEEEAVEVEEAPSFLSGIIQTLFEEQEENIEIAQALLPEAQILSFQDLFARVPTNPRTLEVQQAILLKGQQLSAIESEKDAMLVALVQAIEPNPSQVKLLTAYLEQKGITALRLWWRLEQLPLEDTEIKRLLNRKRELLKNELVVWHEQSAAFFKSEAKTETLSELAVLAESLILGSLLIGYEDNAESYEAGAQVLLQALNGIGRFGEMNGGLSQNLLCIESLVTATHACAMRGDERPFTHESWLHVADWLIHFLMPGRHSVNYGETAGMGVQSRVDSPLAEGLAQIAFLRQEPIALWALKTLFDDYPKTLAGLAASLFAYNESSFQPLPYGYYPQAALLTLRNNWDDSGSGLWVRGGHPRDYSDHNDRGQLAFYSNGKPILIEGGAPFDKEVAGSEDYTSTDAHNVLSIRDARTLKEPAPIIVRLLDEKRCNLRIDASKCYPRLTRWHRDIFWKEGDEMRIVDNLAYKLSRRGRSVFRWHLATSDPVVLVRDRNRYIIEDEFVAIVIQANQPIRVSQTVSSNFSLNNTEELAHTVLLVETLGQPTDVKVVTRVIPKTEE